MATIQDRLKIIMKTNRLTAASFADKVGVQRSGVSHIMSGRNKPSLDFIQKTLKAFPRVNGDWLVTGREIKLDDNLSSEDQKGRGDYEKNDTNVTSDNVTGVTNKKDATVTNQVRKIEKVILFYSDGTYDITYPK
jgi:transcriptional regulator with XRE-family HTH domain